MKSPHYYVLLLLPWLFLSTAQAGITNISSPEVEKGRLETQYEAQRYSGSNAQEHEIEIEYAITERVKFGIAVESEREPGDSGHLAAYGVEGQYQFTEQGPWWLASAVKAEYSFAKRQAEADEAEVELLFARREKDFSAVLNIGLERETGADREHGVGLSAALQGIYIMNEHINPGLEWHGDFGKANLMDGQEHYLGPVITGTLLEYGRSEIEYIAGYYWGFTGPAASNAARIELEYEIEF